MYTNTKHGYSTEWLYIKHFGENTCVDLFKAPPLPLINIDPGLGIDALEIDGINLSEAFEAEVELM